MITTVINRDYGILPYAMPPEVGSDENPHPPQWVGCIALATHFGRLNGERDEINRMLGEITDPNNWNKPTNTISNVMAKILSVQGAPGFGVTGAGIICLGQPTIPILSNVNPEQTEVLDMPNTSETGLSIEYSLAGPVCLSWIAKTGVLHQIVPGVSQTRSPNLVVGTLDLAGISRFSLTPWDTPPSEMFGPQQNTPGVHANIY